MKVLQINSVCGIRSTGRICTDLGDVLAESGHDYKIAYGRLRVPEKYLDRAVRIGSDLDVYTHTFRARLFDSAGRGSSHATKRFLKWVREYDPDVIHLHNLHGYYIDLDLLFAYLREAKKPVIWTLHDCWSFTGHCAHFSTADCQKWRDMCGDCPNKKRYPASLLLDRSSHNFAWKRALIEGVADLTLVTPSKWLADQVRGSFLRHRPVKVIPNGIDLALFSRRESDVRARYGLEEKRIVLGVATAWSKTKGLEILLQLPPLLGDDYRVVLVGLDEKACRRLPAGVIGIPRTDSVSELAELYSAADVFVNPSFQETMGLTTVEAMACGTPVVTSALTAVPEVVTADSGLVVSEQIPEGYAAAIRRALTLTLHPERDAVQYEKRAQYEKYLRLYQEVFSISKEERL